MRMLNIRRLYAHRLIHHVIEHFCTVLEHLTIHLDPIHETRGLQARLRQLGFYAGEVDGDYGERTELAVWGFQMQQGITATGKADDATLAALEKVYSM